MPACQGYYYFLKANTQFTNFFSKKNKYINQNFGLYEKNTRFSSFIAPDVRKRKGSKNKKRI